MTPTSFVRRGLAPVMGLALALTLAACGHSTQVTSGADYLARYAQSQTPPVQTTSGAQTSAGSEAGDKARLDAEVRAAASVEPTLTFPARLGIARVRHGLLAPVQPGEGEAWTGLAERLGPEWGEIVPISPLIAAMASTPQTTPQAGAGSVQGLAVQAPRCHADYRDCLRKTMRDIRLGAARQHLDAVIVYEAFARSEITSNPIAVTKLALIGFFLPSEDVAAEGFAHAVLIDVRNGYTYGMAAAETEKPEVAITTSSNEYQVARRLNLQAEAKAVQALGTEVEAMLRDLRLALAEKRAAEAAVPK